MHKIVQISDLTSRLRAAGYNDPIAYANLSDAELAGFAQKVLTELYAADHSPKFESRDIIDNDPKIDGMPLGFRNVKTGEFFV